MRTTLWWIYWGLWQLLSATYSFLGLFLLLPLAATHAWHERDSEAWMFKGCRVLAWNAAELGAVSVAAIVATLVWVPWPWLKIALGLLLAAGALLGVYDNEEDGVVPPVEVNGAPYHPTWPAWLRAYAWSAVRNAANGMRWLPGAAFLINSSDLTIRRVQGGGYYAVASGRPCKCWKSFRIGWLINLDAATGWRSWPIAGNTKGVSTGALTP